MSRNGIKKYGAWSMAELLFIYLIEYGCPRIR